MKEHIEKETIRMLESHSEEVAKLKAELFEKSHSYDQGLLDLDSLQNQITLNKYNYESKIKGLECELELTSKNNEMTLNNLNNQIRKSNNELKNNLITIEQLQSNNKQLNSNHNNLVKKEEDLIDKYENIMKSNQEKFENKIFESEQKFNNAIRDKVDINEHLIDTRLKLKEIEKLNESLNNNIKDLSIKLENKSVELDKIRRELNSKEKYFSENFNKLKESIKTVKKNFKNDVTNNSHFDTSKLDDLLNFDDIENQLDNSN